MSTPQLWQLLAGLKIPEEKHKLFIAYYHKDDEVRKFLFELKFGSLFISKSVHPGDIDSDLSTEYIKALIQDDYISDASVVMVIIGPKTRCRKHVDWEISAGLNKKVGGYSGLFGALVPGFPLDLYGQYRYDDIPARLADNVKSGYANVYTWDQLTASDASVKNVIQTAFDARVAKSLQIQNWRIQMTYNTCE